MQGVVIWSEMVVATFGKLNEWWRRGILDLTGVKVTVFEEASMMIMVCPAVFVSAIYIVPRFSHHAAIFLF